MWIVIIVSESRNGLKKREREDIDIWYVQLYIKIIINTHGHQTNKSIQ